MSESDVKRYDLRLPGDTSVVESSEDGEWIRYEDHVAALATERRRSRNLREATGRAIRAYQRVMGGKKAADPQSDELIAEARTTLKEECWGDL